MTIAIRRVVGVAILSQLLGHAAIAQDRNTPGAPDKLNRESTGIATPKDAPGSLAEFVVLSPVVIVATVERELPSRFFVNGNSKSDVVTDRIVRVNSVLKGNVAVGAQIAIEELGGSLSRYDGVHSIKQVIVHQKPLQQQHRYLLFLQPGSQIVNDGFDGQYLFTSLRCH